MEADAEANMLRISGGKYRSRNIETPSSLTVPTKNRVREAMMSIVGSYIPGARVLDLFAGSGALGIETLSRGAKEATFVDSSLEACRVIRANLDALHETHGTIFNMEYPRALNKFTEPFDLVFLDPPYADKEAYGKAIDILLEKGLLSPRAAIVLEYEGELAVNHDAFSSRRDYTYGKTKVILLQREP